MEKISSFIDAINRGLGILLACFALLAIAWFILKFYRDNVRKHREALRDGKEPKHTRGEIAFQTFILIVSAIIGILLFALPAIAASVFEKGWLAWLIPAWQWLLTLAGILLIAYLLGHENGEKRWLYTAVGHYAVILFGWLIDRWLGVLFISLPLILIFYAVLYELAHIVLPASNPEDKAERWKRFLILVSYAWGMQLPIIVVGEHAWKKPEVRIPGDFTRDMPFPGMVWVKSHQAVGVTAGNQFKRVDGPGIVFTGKLERPLQIIDLRLQLRTSEIDVVSKDGIGFKARVFTAFRIDNEDWDQGTLERLAGRNPLLKGAGKLDYTGGSFHYSRQRVLATIRTTGSRVDETEGWVFWDRWALNIVEDTARKVVAEKNLDELWKPANDARFANALETIAQEIKARSFDILRSAGILLYAARIVNFSFAEGEEITKQQIASWGAKWASKRIELLSRAQAEAEKMQQEARAYAQAMLLESIAEGLQKAQEIHPGLPRYVIAMRFLSALQDFINRRPVGEERNSEAEQRIANLQNYLRNWQASFFPGSEKG